MKCRMFALSLALGALLCLAPSAAALEPQPEVPILPEKPPIQISYTTPEEIGFTWEEDGLELEVAEVLPVEEISLAPDPDADASAPEAPADSDDTNGTEAAAASDARPRLPTRKRPPPHSPLPRQCPPCPRPAPPAGPPPHWLPLAPACWPPGSA